MQVALLITYILFRSRSLEGERKILSRRQILASLVEEDPYRRMENSDLFATNTFEDCSLYSPTEFDGCGGYSEDGQDATVQDWEEAMEEKSSDSRDDSGESSSESGSLPGGRFSRFTLLESISREEINIHSMEEDKPQDPLQPLGNVR